MSDEFYVGYVPKAPVALGRIIARIAVGLLLASVLTAAVLILDQAPFAGSRFEFGVYREYSGVIEEWPYPMLVTADAAYLLVAPGKHGLAESVRSWQGASVRLRGSLIERKPDRMLEVLAGSLEKIPGASAASRNTIFLGSVTLRGEIVDTKCYLGVMNPGERKVHRDCAARCISGGAPPALVARDASGDARVLLLVGEDRRKLSRELLPFVAEPVELSGELVRTGSTLILKADLASLRRTE